MAFSRDVVTGVVVLVIVLILSYVTTTFDVDALGGTQGMPATKMPRLVLGLIAGLSVFLIVQSLLSEQRVKYSAVSGTVWLTMGLLGAISIGFSYLGLIIAFFMVCVGLPLAWGSRNYKAILAFAFSVPVVIYIIFKIVLGLRLPMGPLAALGL